MHLFVSFIFILIQSASSFAEAQQAAKTLNRPLLLVFSGSDWCRPCIEFDKAVLSQASFNDYCKGSIVFYQADFPRKKELIATQRKENQALAEQYNPAGNFPYIVLFNAQGEKLKSKKGGFDSLTELQAWVKQ
jgi:thioredoxin-related protein